MRSSLNQESLTASAKNQIAGGLKDAGAEVQEIHLNQRKIEHCRPVVRYNRYYMLPALYEAGKTYAERLEKGFDMYY